MSDEMLNLSDAADYLGVTLVTLRKRVKDGKLDAIDDPLDVRQKLVRVNDLNEILRSRGMKPSDAAQILEQRRKERKEVRAKSPKRIAA